MSSVADTRERLLLVVAKRAQLPTVDLDAETCLEDLGLDPKGIVELIIALEDEFETLLDTMELATPYAARSVSLQRLAELFDRAA